jgi:cytoskeleton protein RodZ
MSEAAQALGQRLKTEREKRGVSAQKMADDMHLDAWVIDALEAGDYARIGPAVYAQGHLKKYANILGVSASPDAPAAPAKPAGPPPPTPIIRLDPPGGGASIWPTVGGFAAVALVAGGIVWWRPWHSSRAASASTPAPPAASIPAHEQASSAEHAAAAPAAEQAADAAPEEATADTMHDAAPTPASAVEQGAANVPPAGTQPAAAPANSAELTPGVGRAQLRLSFSADSRVTVYDYTGKVVFSGNGRANSVKTLFGIAPFRVYLGFASGVQLQVNDRAVAIGPQFMSGDVARFEAGADGVLRRDPRPIPVGTTAPAAPTPAPPRG